MSNQIIATKTMMRQFLYRGRRLRLQLLYSETANS